MWSKCNMSEPDPTCICVSLWGHELFEENKWLAVDIYQEPGSPRQWFDIGSSLHRAPYSDSRYCSFILTIFNFPHKWTNLWFIDYILVTMIKINLKINSTIIVPLWYLFQINFSPVYNLCFSNFTLPISKHEYNDLNKNNV